MSLFENRWFNLVALVVVLLACTTAALKIAESSEIGTAERRVLEPPVNPASTTPQVSPYEKPSLPVPENRDTTPPVILPYIYDQTAAQIYKWKTEKNGTRTAYSGYSKDGLRLSSSNGVGNSRLKLTISCDSAIAFLSATLDVQSIDLCGPADLSSVKHKKELSADRKICLAPLISKSVITVHLSCFWQ
jgi:hypothetical protein